MPIAELVLDSSPSNFESFYFKATDQHTSLVVLVASKDQFKRLLLSAGGAPGLYILQAEDSTVYVGKSIDLAVRLRNHKTNDKIGYRRAMVMMRDQGISRYLDYGEAKVYETLRDLGYRLEQSPLSGSLEVKRQRLSSMDAEHVSMADGLVKQFLSYSVALGLARPVVVGPSFLQLAEPTSTRIAATQPTPRKALRLAESPAPEVTQPPLQVLLTSGEVIAKATATGTFVSAIQIAGLHKVAGLDLTLSGEPLISKTKSTKYPGASKSAGALFVMTHSNTATKARILERVSTALGLAWTVRVPN